MYKIIEHDGQDRSGEVPGHDERLVVMVNSRDTAHLLCMMLLNDLETGQSFDTWYKVENADYEIKRFQP